MTCQAHPVLVKKANEMCGPFLLRFLSRSWLTPHVGGSPVGLVHLWTDQRIPAQAVRWRPRLAGTLQYARISVYSDTKYCFGKRFVTVCLTPYWCTTQCVRTQRSHTAELLFNYIRLDLNVCLLVQGAVIMHDSGF